MIWIVGIVCFILGIGLTVFASYVGNYIAAKKEMKSIDQELLKISKQDG